MNMNTVEISPRLMPGVRVGDTWISVDPTTETDHCGKPIWNWYIDSREFGEYEGSDLAGWGNAGEMLGTMLTFLGAFAEAVNYETRTGRETENSDLFPDGLKEWATLNSGEIDMVRYDLEGES